MDYGLNSEKAAFSYTREELFQCITKIVSHPHSVVTSHDQSRALAILTVLEDYLANFTHRDGDGEYYIPECDGLDFQDFVVEKLGLEYYHYVSADEVLK